MLLGLHPIDFGVLLLFFGGMLAIGCYFRRTTSQEFFLAGRSMRWPLLGFAFVATLVPGSTIVDIPGAGYEAGFQLLIVPAILLLVIPAGGFLVAMYRQLDLTSVFEYLELRFSASIRCLCSLLFIACRIGWLGAVLGVPFHLLAATATSDVPQWLFIAVTGLVVTMTAALGGMKALIWSDVTRLLLVLFAVIILVSAACWKLNGGPSRVWEVATALDRNSFVPPSTNSDSNTQLWFAAPHYVLLFLSFFVVDQIALQRYFSARTVLDAQRSLVLNGLFAVMLLCGLVYLGLCLLAFYHDHPQDLRPKWIANVHGESRQSMTYADRDQLQGKSGMVANVRRPLLDWNDPQDDVTASTVDQLVHDQKILHPNRKTPWEDTSELLDSEYPLRLDLEKLATRRPPKGSLIKGEVLLNVRAIPELTPWFITTQLPVGMKGIVLVGIIAATMCTLNAGVLSIATLIIVDFRQRFGVGSKWFTRDLPSTEEDFNEANALMLARTCTTLTGLLTTVLAIVFSGMNSRLLLYGLGCLGAPLLGVFLLGIVTRRTNSVGARLALLNGYMLSIWLLFAQSSETSPGRFPFTHTLDSIWWMPLITGVTVVTGFGSSFFWGKSKGRNELRGLVFGCGPRRP